MNWVLAQTPAGLEPLVVNMDETSVPRTYPGQRGNRADWAPPGQPAPPRLERTNLGDRRGGITYVAFVCADATVQNDLPQILIGNRYRFTGRLLREVLPSKPPYVHLWVEESGWMSHRLLRRVLALLADCLRAHLASRQVVLVLDCARSHIHADLVNVACRLGIWLVFVPSKLTWLLQPLDTHAFARFKLTLRRLFTAARMASAQGALEPAAWCRAIFLAIAAVFRDSDWHRPFARVGLTAGQASLSPHIAGYVLRDGDPPFAAERPHRAALAQLGGSRVRMPFLQLLRPVELRASGSLAALTSGLPEDLRTQPARAHRPPARYAALPAPAPGPGPPARAAPVPWRGRRTLPLTFVGREPPLAPGGSQPPPARPPRAPARAPSRSRSPRRPGARSARTPAERRAAAAAARAPTTSPGPPPGPGHAMTTRSRRPSRRSCSGDGR